MSKFQEYQERLLKSRDEFKKKFPDKADKQFEENLTWLSNSIMKENASEPWYSINEHIDAVKKVIEPILTAQNTEKNGLIENNEWLNSAFELEEIGKQYRTDPEYTNIFTQYDEILGRLTIVENLQGILSDITGEYEYDSQTL